jgi:methionine salvage enolase-phosphatase E1
VDGLYCYVVIPYGLKNALPTFVRAMSKTFGDLIRDKVEVYVDDIVVKTKRGSTLVEDLTLVFDRLRATRTSASLVSLQGSCWGSWFHTGALKQTQRRSRQLRQ